MDKFAVLQKYFGYSAFRDGQERLIDSILAGRDVLGIMPTGAGKSICYQVPALLLPGITLVISPLISLMKDQVQALNQAGIHAAYINSSLSEAQVSKALRLAAGGQYKIIYAAPERLETYEFLQAAAQMDISMVTVDEAHCISHWGPDFRPSYKKIVQFINRLEKRPILSAFTATATEEVKEDIVCVLGLEEPDVLVTGFDRKNLYFAVETPSKKDAFVLDYVKQHASESGIIYCATRKNVDELCEKLCLGGIAAVKYHAGLGNEERRQNQEAFLYDQSPVMAATNAFGMGIDKSNVRYVIHYNMPQSVENYYQEAGRAGRDGARADCILLYSAQDLMINRYLLDHKQPKEEMTREQTEAVREKDEERLRAMTFYCMTAGCLREYILRYFGERAPDRCDNCRNCAVEFEETDVTDAAVKVTACILETGQRYGINVTAGILAGENRAKLREYGAAQYQAYGSLKQYAEAEIKALINEMIVQSLLVMTNDKYAVLKISPQADEVLQGERRVIWKKRKTDQAASASRQSGGRMRRSDLLNSKGLELFERLRMLRREIAREESLPPYIIFSDKTLTDLCVKAPFDKEEMLRVSGVGENKFERYGRRFLDCIYEFCGGIREKYYFGEEQEPVPAQGRTGGGKTVKTDFYLTESQAARFPYAEQYHAAELAVQLNELRDAQRVKKISGAEIFRRMQACGYADEKMADGYRKKTVTEKGRAAGLRIGTRLSRKGTEYEDIFYNRQAQEMLLAMAQECAELRIPYKCDSSVRGGFCEAKL